VAAEMGLVGKISKETIPPPSEQPFSSVPFVFSLSQVVLFWGASLLIAYSSRCNEASSEAPVAALDRRRARATAAPSLPKRGSPVSMTAGCPVVDQLPRQ
jgi:hypothetical protein